MRNKQKQLSDICFSMLEKWHLGDHLMVDFYKHKMFEILREYDKERYEQAVVSAANVILRKEEKEKVDKANEELYQGQVLTKPKRY